jgi:hypothetical protein
MVFRGGKGWACVFGETINAYKIVNRKPERKITLGTSKLRF